MEVGLSVRHAMQSSPGHVREIAVAAEEKGIRTVWVPEHTVVPTSYDSRYPYAPEARLPFPADTVYCDPTAILAHIAAVTTTLRLATNVIPIITRHPIALAKQAATVDLLSEGRLELGLGAGWLAEEAEVLGLPSDKRGQRLDETIEILRKAWTGTPFTHSGELWDIPEVVVSPAPRQGPDVPLWIGGGSPRAMRTIARSAVGSILPPGPRGLEMLAEMRKEVPATTQFVIPLPVSADQPNRDLLERCRELADAGVDQVLVYTEPDPQVGLETVRALDIEGIRAIA